MQLAAIQSQAVQPIPGLSVAACAGACYLVRIVHLCMSALHVVKGAAYMQQLGAVYMQQFWTFTCQLLVLLPSAAFALPWQSSHRSNTSIM